MPSHSSPTSKEILKEILTIFEDLKADDLQVYQMSEQFSYTDYVLLATANSTTHSKALAKKIIEHCKGLDIESLNRNKKEESNPWIVLDFADFIVHIFTKETREYFNLEEIYSECSSITL